MTLPNSSSNTSSIRPVHLAVDGHGAFWVHPPLDEQPAPFSPFPLPKVSTNQFGWLMAVGHTHCERTRRGLAVLLLLDVETRRWRFCIPWQRCSADSACWRLDRRDGLDLGAHERLAGVYQALMTADPAELLHAVPPVSGLHLMQHFTDGQAGFLVGMRMGDQSMVPVHPSLVMHDEVTEVLAMSAPRLQMV